MIRQARSYLAGAVSGAALIAAAIVAFILLLVSTEGFRDFPIVSFGGGESASVAPARPAVPGASSGTAASATAASRGVGDSDRSASTTQQGDLATGGSQGTVTSPASGNPGGGGGGSSPSPGSASTPTSGGGSGSNPSGGGRAGNGGDSVSVTVAGTVNDAVDRVDGALGGAPGRTGVTDVTQGAVDRVAGANSAVGQTVDGTVGAVRGLLNDGR